MNRFEQALARWWAGRTRSVEIDAGWAVPPLRDYPAGRPIGVRRSKVSGTRKE
jgi:hypothetical protein